MTDVEKKSVKVLDLRDDHKTISSYVLKKVVDKLRITNELELFTDNFPGLQNDILAWGRLSGHHVEQVVRVDDFHHFYSQFKRDLEVF